ncbi:MAG: hypothetical protein ABSC94_20295 [Polyangiaceae bacterium]|jgi:hypothetical protein
MRLNFVLVVALGAALIAPMVGGCGSSGESAFSSESSQSSAGFDAGSGFDGPTVLFVAPDSSSSASSSGDGATSAGSVLSNVHIVPANASLTVQAGQTATLAFSVMGTLDGASAEVDVTDRFVFYVPDNYLVGGFPLSGAPVFTTRLPATATDPPQRGGALTVLASAMNPSDQLVTTTTALTVQLEAQLSYEATTSDAGSEASAAGADAENEATTGSAGEVPANAASLFSGSADPTRAPFIAYPNDGAMLPPNLRLLDVHWVPGSVSNTLYQISFVSPAATITYYSRCGSMGGLLVAGACGFQLDATGYAYLANSNAGQGNVTITIRGTDDGGTAVGTSQPIQVQFAQSSVNGGVYYWDVSHTRIMRFDFGGTSDSPEVFLAPGQYGTSGTCVGCHALSPDGTKLAASAGGQNDGYLVYIDGVAAPTTPLTVNEDTANRIQFASFDPLGDLFVGIYGDGSPLDPHSLYFHDGTTGLIIPSLTKALSFEPDHPSWSPDGRMIAMTHVGSHNTSQMEYLGGIDVATFIPSAVNDGGVTLTDGGATLGDPVVVIPSRTMEGTTAVNSYNPSFAPDSSFLVFTQTICTTAQATTDVCDSDISSNVSATTWAVQPTAGAIPIHLANASAPGIADGAGASILDTFPRSTPFETQQGTGRLFWFTVASIRQPGLRYKGYKASDEGTGQTQQQLWMFAVDPAKILAGQDGSYPAFFLPFQDPTTSNHIAQWTQKIVSASVPPAAPAPPPPPPAPAPPPAPTPK